MSSHLRTVHNIVTFVTSASLSEQSQMTFTAVVRIIVFVLALATLLRQRSKTSVSTATFLWKRKLVLPSRRKCHTRRSASLSIPVNTCLSDEEAKICFTLCCIDSPKSALAAPPILLSVCVCVCVCVCVRVCVYMYS